MNRDEFTKLQAQMDARDDLLRLDSMNPFTTMSFLKQTFDLAAHCPQETTLAQWAQSMDIADHAEKAIAAKGVRAALTGMFKTYKAQGRELWLAEDVYPFYWQAAEEAGLTPKSFKTLPAPDFSPLENASSDAVILLTSPVSPLGRDMTGAEREALEHWLESGSERRLILDTVYTYQRHFDDAARTLYEGGQTILLHSLSKSWLERGVFGIVLAPQDDLDTLRGAIEPPSPEACTSAYMAMVRQPDLPDTQQRTFTEEWNRLLPQIRAFDPDFQPPESGYFGIVNAPYEEVLEKHNTLVIPASVFGSKNKNLSIVSCLQTLAPK